MDGNLLRTLGLIALVVAGTSLLLALVVLVLAYVQLRRLRLRQGMGFVETLRAVPLPLVIGLDLLDMALDVFSAPISWIVLTRLRLQGLRTVAVVKDLIPFTNFIPALTIAWIAVRAFNLRGDEPFNSWIDVTPRPSPPRQLPGPRA